MRYLNIEIVLSIIAGGVFAALTLNTTLPISWFVVVPLVTWAVYVADRLLDTMRDVAGTDTDRHRFHREHRTVLCTTLASALLISAVTAYIYFPLDYWIAALPLGGLTLVHYVLHRAPSKPLAVAKDVNVAVTFSASAWLIPAVQIGIGNFTLSDAYLFAAYTGLVVVAVLLLSVSDSEGDALRGTSSVAVALTPRVTLRLARLLCVLVSLAGGLHFAVLGTYVAQHVVLWAIAGSYLVASVVPFSNNTQHRLILDCVLILPLILPLILALT